MNDDFEEGASLAFEPEEAIAAYLDDIEDLEAAAALRRKVVRGQSIASLLGLEYAISAHHYGYISESETGRAPIVPATSVKPDPDLVNTAVKVTLEKFYVESYPGIGRHTILLEVLGRNQAGSEAEDLRFTSVVEANDRDSVAIAGIPLFVGLRVPPDGIAFKGRTIGLRSSGDAMIVDALKSGAFQSGMKLLGHVQPVIPQFVQLAAGVTAGLAKRRLNKQIQTFQLGLDFSDQSTAPSLRLGAYVVVQAPDDGSWSWSDWIYDFDRSNVVHAETGNQAPYNTMVFRISKSHVETPASATRSDDQDKARPARRRSTKSMPA